PTPLNSGFVSPPAQAGTNPETRRITSRVNGHGHAFSSHRVSGFVLANPEIHSIEATTSPLSLDAGSDDANGASVAIAPTQVGAGADRDACAALAGSQSLYLPAQAGLQTLNQAKTSNVKKRHSSRTIPCDEEQPRVPSEVLDETGSQKGTQPHS